MDTIRISSSDREKIADALETFASIDEGEYTDTDELRRLAAIMRDSTGDTADAAIGLRRVHAFIIGESDRNTYSRGEIDGMISDLERAAHLLGGTPVGDRLPVTVMGTCPHCGENDPHKFYDNREDEYAWCYSCRQHSVSFFATDETRKRLMGVETVDPPVELAPGPDFAPPTAAMDEEQQISEASAVLDPLLGISPAETILRDLLSPKDEEERRRRRVALIGEVVKLRDEKSQRERPLSDAEWSALEEAEQALYPMNDGLNGWTDVMENDGSATLNALMDQAKTYVEMDPEQTPDALQETANRVAAALSILAFGVGAVDLSRLDTPADRL